MELSSDWRGFQSVFYPSRRTLTRQNPDSSRPVYVVEDAGAVAALFSEGEDLSDWIGASRDELLQKLGASRTLVFLERAELDRWVAGSLGMSHFVEQSEYFRECSFEALKTHGAAGKAAPARELVHDRHFFLEAVRSWWSKVLPSAYGLFIRLEGQPAEDVFVLVRRGRIESYGRPDLGILGEARGDDPEAIVKYLTEKHMVPVQGLFVPGYEWLDWTQSSQPWRKLALSVRADRAKLVPFRWGMIGLIVGRGFLSL